MRRLLALAAFALVCSCPWIGTSAHATLIGVDVGTGTGSPINWNTYTLADSGSTITGLVDEAGSATTATLRLQTPAGNGSNAPFSPSVLPSHPNPLDSLCCDFLYGGSNPMTITVEGLAPNAVYDYWIVTSSLWDDTITATGSTVDVFASPPTTTDSQRINGVLGSSASTFQSYARQVVSTASGTVVFSYASTGTPVLSAVAMQLVPEPGTGLLVATGVLALAARRRRCAN